jgi:hypothetical protein
LTAANLLGALRHGRHADHRFPMRVDRGERALIAAVLERAIEDYLGWTSMLDRPDFSTWATIWARRDLRQKVAEVADWFFWYRGPGLTLDAAAETLGFSVSDLRAALKTERFKRYVRFLDRGPAPASRAKRPAQRLGRRSCNEKKHSALQTGLGEPRQGDQPYWPAPRKGILGRGGGRDIFGDAIKAKEHRGIVAAMRQL